MTYTLILHFAETLSRINPEMTFCYVSGASTDSTEKDRSMRARVKRKTENDLMKLPFKTVFNFRPGISGICYNACRIGAGDDIGNTQRLFKEYN